MKVWFSHKSGSPEHSGNFFRRAFAELGHDVMWATTPTGIVPGDGSGASEPGYAATASIEALAAQGGAPPDLFFYTEPFGLIPLGLEAAPFPTACYIHDPHCDLAPRVLLAKFFDHVFVAQRDYLERFRQYGARNVWWLPVACDPKLHREVDGPKRFDVAFIGSLANSTERALLIKTLRAECCVNPQRFYAPDEFASVYGAAKIVVNWPIAGDLTLRVFEAMASGAFVISREVENGQEVLFKDGVHLVTVRTVAEAVEKVRYFLANEGERRKIAEQGRDLVRSEHCWKDRARQVLQTISTAPKQSAWIRGQSPREVIRAYAKLFVMWRIVDPVFALIRFSRRSGRPWRWLLPYVLAANMKALNHELRLLTPLRAALRGSAASKRS